MSKARAPIGQAALARRAFFINLSRGNLVDEAAMDIGRALDQMPLPELAKLPNVIRRLSAA